MKKIALGIIAFIFLVGIFAYKIQQVPLLPIHYHANFAVFVNGQQQDYSSPLLMSIAPCTDDHHDETDLHKLVHLHDQVGNVVHVHGDGVAWRILFENLKLDVEQKNSGTQSGTVSFYLQEKKVGSEIIDQVIGKNDQLLVHVATQSGAEQLSMDPQLQKEQAAVGTSAHTYDEQTAGENCSGNQPRSLWKRFQLAFGL